MSEWHLDALHTALTQRGWRLLTTDPGDDHSVSGSWQIQRSTRRPPLWIDFDGRDDLRCLPMSESYACHVRGGTPWLYFRRPGEKWRAELANFLRDLDMSTSFPRPTLPMRRVGDERTMSATLAADRAILLLHAEWSMPSVMAWNSFQKWAAERTVADAVGAIAVFVAINSNDYPPRVVAWLKGQGLEHLAAAASGEVLWLQGGRVLSKLVYSPDGVVRELTHRTNVLWGMES